MTLESGKFHVLNLFLTLPYQYLNNIFIPKNSEKPVKNSDDIYIKGKWICLKNKN